jgi:hypothetical protein
MRRNDSRVIQAVAEAAGLSADAFNVEEDQGVVLVNHPDSMTWSKETRNAVKTAATRITGMQVSIT